MRPILVITYWSFKDALIQTYTLPYVRIIARLSSRRVFLVCLEQNHIAASAYERQTINAELDKENIEVVFFDYHPFGIRQAATMGINMAKLLYLIISKRIAFLHTWCTPGGAIGYILSMLSGRKLILDSYEPHAELMVETGTWQRSGIAFRILFKLEQLQTRRAYKIIGVVDEMKEYSLQKYHIEIPSQKFFVKPACVDLEWFYPRPKPEALLQELGLQDKTVGLYAGKIGGIYLENELFDFIAMCYNHWGENFRMLILTNAEKEVIQAQLKRVKVPSRAVIQKFVFHEEIPQYMALADFALNFMKPVPSRRYSAPIKDAEYWAMGLPVVITAGIADDSDIIKNNNVGYSLTELTTAEYKNAILKIEHLLNTNVLEMQQRVRNIAVLHRSFDIAADIYKKLYVESDEADSASNILA